MRTDQSPSARVNSFIKHIFSYNLFIYVFIHLNPSYHEKINNVGENRSAI